MEVREPRQLAQLGRQPFELVVVDLERHTELREIRIHLERVSHMKPLEIGQMANFLWQRRELVAVSLKTKNTRVRHSQKPGLPHVEHLETDQQTERRELVVVDLKSTWLLVKTTIQSLRQSHIELFELRQVRNCSRQRAEVVVQPQLLHVLHAEQLGRHLCQTHA
jgi:hypothetical protein